MLKYAVHPVLYECTNKGLKESALYKVIDGRHGKRHAYTNKNTKHDTSREKCPGRVVHGPTGYPL